MDNIQCELSESLGARVHKYNTWMYRGHTHTHTHNYSDFFIVTISVGLTQARPNDLSKTLMALCQVCGQDKSCYLHQAQLTSVSLFVVSSGLGVCCSTTSLTAWRF